MEVVITARPPLALHCSDSQHGTIQEKHRKICKNELKHIDKDKKTVHARAKAKVKAKAKLND